MNEETVVAAPSAVEETPATPEFDHSRGPLVDLSPEQRSEYKRTGQLPKAPEPKKEESAPSPEPKAQPESDTEPEADAGTGKQEHTGKKAKPTAEERIAQLEATIEKIRKGAGIERKAESAPAPVEQPKPQPNQPPQNYQEWRKQFKPSLWIEEYAKANPEASYEDANAAMSDFLDEVRGQFRAREQAFNTQKQKWDAQLAEAKTRYENFDEIKGHFAEHVVMDQQVPFALKELINDSEVLPDLIYTIAGKPEELAKFVSMAKTNPTRAARYIALTESLIQQELEAKAAPKEPVKADPPAQPKTSAPKPPTEVGGRAASPGDELESAAKANDYRRFAAESTRRALARMKG